MDEVKTSWGQRSRILAHLEWIHQRNENKPSTRRKNVLTFIEAPKISDTTMAAFIWKNAEDLWGDFKHTDFGKIILPFTLLRRLECVLEPTRDAVRKAYEKFKAKGLDTDLILRQTAGLPFYNTSLYSLTSLGATKTKSNLDAYIAGFSDNARVIFDQFNFTDTIARLARADILFKICQNFANTDLHPDVVPDRVMSNIYEHLIRRFGAEVNEAAEDFMTPPRCGPSGHHIVAGH